MNQNKKNIFFRITAILLAVSALSPVVNARVNAQAVLDKVVNSIWSASSVHIDMSIQNGPQVYRAELAMAKEKFVYSTYGMNVYFNGKTQWTVDYESKEVSISEPTPEELSETNPLAFLKSYKQNYSTELIGESGGTYTVKMTALKKSSYIRSAQVVISSSTYFPTHITAKLSTGQTITISVLSSSKGSSLPMSTFQYKIEEHPDFELIDLR